jgi:hypothetical protein
MHAWSAHSIHENLARDQAQLRYASRCRDHDGVINGPRAIKQSPSRFRRKFSVDRNGGRLHRNIDRDLFQPHATVGFLRRVDLQFVRVRAVNQYGTVMVLNTYVCVWLDRVDPLKSFLEKGLTFRVAARKRQQQ